MKNWTDALRAQGHEVLEWPLHKQSILSIAHGGAQLEIDPAFLSEIYAFRPDYVLSYGLAGLIPMPGNTAPAPSLFHEIGAREILLFYDTPLGMESELYSLPRRDALVFCWDSTYLDVFRAAGLSHVHYLPLGTSLQQHPVTPAATTNTQPVFVGRIHAPDQTFAGSPALHQAQARYLSAKARYPAASFDQLLRAVINSLSGEARTGFETFLHSERAMPFLLDTWRRADTAYRQQAIDLMGKEFNICVYSNAQEAVNPEQRITIKPEVSYGAPLARVYAAAPLNLNLTNSHLRTAVNQRVFDIPAVRGVLLTDWRANLEQLFDIDTEIICFHSLEEMIDKARYYLAHPAAGKAIAEKAHRRVTAHHTWRHRAKKLLQILDDAK